MEDALLKGINEEQRQAINHADGPLLIIAGAGTGKTTTLVHHVAQLIERGINPSRVLLLTFARRAAAEMLRRVDHLLNLTNRCRSDRQDGSPNVSSRVWGGTFHAVSARLLRIYGKAGSDQHSYAQRTRFLPDHLLHFFECHAANGPLEESNVKAPASLSTAQNVRQRVAAIWS